MVKNSWIKLYHEILSDSKMGRMNDHLFRRTIELFLLAGQEGKDGILPDIDGIAWSLHTTTKDIQTTINSLIKLNIVEERINPLEEYLGLEPKKRYAIKHFAFRQKSEQTKSESNRAYYEKQKLKKTEIQTESDSEIQTEIQYTDKDIDIDKEKNKNKREIRDREDKREIQTEKQKPAKTSYGEFQHVLLTDEEAQKLSEKFPDVAERLADSRQPHPCRKHPPSFGPGPQNRVPEINNSRYNNQDSLRARLAECWMRWNRRRLNRWWTYDHKRKHW